MEPSLTQGIFCIKCIKRYLFLKMHYQYSAKSRWGQKNSQEMNQYLFCPINWFYFLLLCMIKRLVHLLVCGCLCGKKMRLCVEKQTSDLSLSEQIKCCVYIDSTVQSQVTLVKDSASLLAQQLNSVKWKNALRSLKIKGPDSHSVYMAVILNALMLDVCIYTDNSIGREMV